ncbi:hypothetical protein DL765_003392 [Monosporascus sp. GIB2]|nr:hypothetical protein DL765_003392 [Monosporascus sp. GIB2]
MLKLSGILQVDISTISRAVAKWYKTRFSGVFPVKVTSWHDFSDGYRQVRFGPIVKTRPGTAAGVRKEFLNPTTGGSVCLSYRKDPYEKLPREPPNHGAAALVPGWRLVARQRQQLQVLGGAGESLLWSRAWRGPENDESPIIAIEVSYKVLSSEPRRLTLVYGGARSARSASGPRSKNCFRPNPNSSLSFFTNTSRKLHFSEWQAAATTPSPELSSRAYVLAEASRSQGMGDGVKSVRDFRRMDGVGAFVGLWAVPRRRDRSLRHNPLGPLSRRRRTGARDEWGGDGQTVGEGGEGIWSDIDKARMRERMTGRYTLRARFTSGFASFASMPAAPSAAYWYSWLPTWIHLDHAV